MCVFKKERQQIPSTTQLHYYTYAENERKGNKFAAMAVPRARLARACTFLILCNVFCCAVLCHALHHVFDVFLCCLRRDCNFRNSPSHHIHHIFGFSLAALHDVVSNVSFRSVLFRFKSKVKRILPRNVNEHFIGSKLWFDIFSVVLYYSISGALFLPLSWSLSLRVALLTIAWLFHIYLWLLESFRFPLCSRNVYKSSSSFRLLKFNARPENCCYRSQLFGEV